MLASQGLKGIIFVKLAVIEIVENPRREEEVKYHI